jgi:hypothetical protein
VFVADSSPEKMAENRESLSNLEKNLKSYGLDLKTIPWVMQFNKRDLPNALSIAQMNKELNRYSAPTFEAQAASGIGVFETLRGVSKLLLSKISKDVIDRDRGSLAAPPRVRAEEAKHSPAAVEEAPTQSAESPSGRGKLMQFLKRGKGQEAPASAPERPTRAPAEEAPMLSEDSLVEESLSGGAFKPPASMQPDETVLTKEDLVPIREPVITRQDDADPGFSVGEIERESTYSTRSSSLGEPTSGDTRQITVPIELGPLPASGRLKLVFEVRIEVVDSADAKKGKKSSRGGTMMRDLEVIPD